jgi:hypothetical protein
MTGSARGLKGGRFNYALRKRLFKVAKREIENQPVFQKKQEIR